MMQHWKVHKTVWKVLVVPGMSWDNQEVHKNHMEGAGGTRDELGQPGGPQNRMEGAVVPGMSWGIKEVTKLYGRCWWYQG